MLGFILGAVYPVGLIKYVLMCIPHYSITWSIFTALQTLCSLPLHPLSPLNPWQPTDFEIIWDYTSNGFCTLPYNDALKYSSHFLFSLCAPTVESCLAFCTSLECFPFPHHVFLGLFLVSSFISLPLVLFSPQYVF